MRSERRSDKELARMMEILDQLPSDLDELVERMADPDHLVRMEVATKLRQIENPAAVGYLLKLLEDEHSEVRSSAALALGHYDDKSALPAVVDHMLNDTNPKVRWMSMFAVDRIGKEDAVEALERALDDPDEHLRSAACWQFVHRKDHRALPQIRVLFTESDPLLRSAAAEMLIRLELVDEPVMDVLVNDPSWTVRQSVAEELILAGIKDERIAQTIECLIQQPEAEQYEAGVAAYEEAMKSIESDEDEQELSEKEQEELREMEEDIEDSRPKRLAELLERAYRLLAKDPSEE